MARLHLPIAHEHLILYRFFLFVEALAELLPLFGQHEGLRQKVEVLLREALLHLNHINRQSVLPRQFRARWEVVNLLVLIKSLVKVVFALGVGPKHVPVVTVGRDQAVDLEDEAHQL